MFCCASSSHAPFVPLTLTAPQTSCLLQVQHQIVAHGPRRGPHVATTSVGHQVCPAHATIQPPVNCALSIFQRQVDQRSGCSGKSKSGGSRCIKKVAQKQASDMLRDNSLLATKLTFEQNGEQKIVTVFNKVDGYKRASHLSLGVDEYEICQFMPSDPSTATNNTPQDGAINIEATVNASDSEAAADGEGAVVTASDTWTCLMCSKQSGDHESVGECARRQWYKRNRVDLPKRGRAPNTVFGCTYSYEMAEHCKYGLHYYAVASKVHDLIGRDWTLAQHKGDANHMQYSYYAA